MRSIYPVCFTLLVSFGVLSCGSEGPITQNTANLSTPASQPTANPDWPYPDWTSDTAPVPENVTQVVFKAEKLTELTLAIPADWVKLGNKPSFLLYKTPTEDTRFGNLIIQSSNTKPNLMYPATNFDYSGFEPDAALKDFLEKRKADPAPGRLQQIAVDGVWGILQQVMVKEPVVANMPEKEPTAMWHWTTFMKSKIENNKFEIIVGYPSSEIEKFKPKIAGLINSVKITRTPGIVLLESKP